MLTGQGLAEYAISLLGSPYMYGVNGLVVSEALIQSKARQYPNMYTAGYIAKCRALIGKVAYDCSSITDLYCGKDKSANGWLAYCSEKGEISTMPDIVGLIVHKDGHMGVHIGGGWAVEARGIDYGVVKTRIADRPWTSWGKVPDLAYDTAGSGGGDIMLQKGDKGLAVTYWQKALMKQNPAALPKFGADSDFGGETEAWTKTYQAAVGVAQSGIVDNLTFGHMLNSLMQIDKPALDAAKLKVAELTQGLADANNRLAIEQNLTAQYVASDRDKKAELQKVAQLFAEMNDIKNKYLI